MSLIGINTILFLLKLKIKAFDMAKDKLAEFIPGMEATVELGWRKKINCSIFNQTIC